MPVFGTSRIPRPGRTPESNVKRPRVSILLPTFDSATAIEACLESITRQTEPNWECTVVDDGSRDDTVARVAAVARQDPRFLLVSRSHQGLVRTLNAGLSHCRAPLVARMDADDIMHSQRLAAQCALLEHDRGLAAAGTHVRLFPRSILLDGLRAYEAWLNSLATPDDVARDALVECPVAHPTLMIRRHVLEAHPYRDRGWPEDYDLVLRLLGGGHKIGIVPRRLLCWRDSTTRLSRTAPAYRIERFVACKAAHLSRTLLAGRDDYALWGYGPTGRAMFRALEKHGKRPACIIEVNPRKIGQRIHGTPVVPPDRLPPPRTLPIVVAVSGPGPRATIRNQMARTGHRELEDFVCTA